MGGEGREKGEVWNIAYKCRVVFVLVIDGSFVCAIGWFVGVGVTGL